MEQGWISQIRQLLEDVEQLARGDEVKLDALKRRAKMLITKAFGGSSDYLKDLTALRFYPGAYWEGMEDHYNDEAWAGGKASFHNLCATMIEDLKLSGKVHPEAERRAPNTRAFGDGNRVFIVHGHDEAMKSEVARTLEKLGLKPIILHEQPDKNRTVIEKFEDHSDVGFAIVLLSGDDMAYAKSGKAADARPRARQNVILELGFFLGKLGRDHVLTLYRDVADFELPSDYNGVLYKEFDSRGAWKFEMCKELRAAGYDVDANSL